MTSFQNGVQPVDHSFRHSKLVRCTEFITTPFKIRAEDFCEKCIQSAQMAEIFFTKNAMQFSFSFHLI